MPIVRKKVVQAGANHRYYHERVAAAGTKAGQLDYEVQYSGDSPSTDADSPQPASSPPNAQITMTDSEEARKVKYSGRCSNACIPEKNRKCFDLANIFLRAKIVAENPWPTADQGKKMIRKSWKEAREFRMQDIAITGYSADYLEEDDAPDPQSTAKVCRVRLIDNSSH